MSAALVRKSSSFIWRGVKGRESRVRTPGFAEATYFQDNKRHWRNLHKAALLQENTNADLLDDQHGPHYETRVEGETVSNPNLNATTPAATSGNVNVAWQTDDDGNVSAQVPVAGDVSGPGSATVCNAACFANVDGKSIQDSGVPTSNIVQAAANIQEDHIVVGSGGVKGVKEGSHTIAEVITAADRMNEAPTQVQATVLGTPWEYTLDPSIRFLNVLSDEGGQVVTVFLPTAPAAGQAFFIRNSRDSTENIEISGAPGGHEIDGSGGVFVMVPGESVLLKFSAVDDWGVW